MRLTDQLAEMLDAALHRHDLPGALLGIRTAEGSTVVAAGLANVQTGEPLTPDHAFRLWSIVKPAVGLAFAHLVDTGRLVWSDTAGALLPDLRGTDTGRATLDQLLGMTAGLAEVPLAVPPTGDTPAALVRAIAAAVLADPPGIARACR
jgi:D-alanyl-D-alanine carboxypeptidase